MGMKGCCSEYRFGVEIRLGTWDAGCSSLNLLEALLFFPACPIGGKERLLLICSYFGEGDKERKEQSFPSPLESTPFSPGVLMPSVLSILYKGCPSQLGLYHHARSLRF